MGAVREIQREQWPVVFDEITQWQGGQSVSVEERGDNVGEGVQVTDLPLRGISFGGKGGDVGAVEVMLGIDTADHLTHYITTPARVRVTYGDAGTAESIEIEARSEPTTVITFHPGYAPSS